MNSRCRVTGSRTVEPQQHHSTQENGPSAGVKPIPTLELSAAPDGLRGFLLRRRRVDLQLSLQRGTERGQVPVAHHLPQARFDVQERGRQPAVALT